MEAGDDAAPEWVGPYRIVGVLGAGGMGIVYRARRGERSVAVKTVKLPTPEALASIRLEISTLSRLRHPDVVEIVDQGVSNAGPWYAMELLEGETLADRNQQIWPRHASEMSTPRVAFEVLDSSGHAGGTGAAEQRLPLFMAPIARAAGGHLAEVLTIYRRLCAPLAFLHGKGIVHRDLKPANVFLRANQSPVLMDFGLMTRARGAVGREALEGTRGIRGTLSYLAPEICDGQTPDTRADLYALGCMIWETLTGRPPFEAATATELLGMHLRTAPGRPSEVVLGVPEALDELVVRLLAKRPRDRLGHAEDVAEALSEIEGLSQRESSSSGIRRTGYLLRSKLVGRDLALAALLAHAGRAGAGAGALALVAGESGIGKTFLASEVAQQAAVAGLRVITGECVPVAVNESSLAERSGAPLHPFRQVLQAMGDRCRQLGAVETARLFASHLKLLVPYEPSLAELAGSAEAPEPAPLPAEAARTRLLAVLREALVAFVAGAPTLIVLDDLQWADDLTLALVGSFTPDLFAANPLLVIGTYRTDEASPELRGLVARDWIHRVELGRLDGPDVAIMVTHMLAAGPAPEALVQFVQQHSEGIPFFVAEYLRAATVKGVLTRRHGRWIVGEHTSPSDSAAAALAAIVLPQKVAGLVRLRLSRLSPPALAAAETAAVWGREFESWALAETAGLEPPILETALVELIARQVIEGAGVGRYRFLHDKIREEAYAGLDRERRREVHGLAARAFERRMNDEQRSPPPYAEMAFHLLAAGKDSAAMSCLALAGEQSLAVSAHRDAARQFQEALTLATEFPDELPPLRRATWERQLGDALQGLGRLSDSIPVLERAAAALGYPMPRSRPGIALRLIGELARQAFHRWFPEHFSGRRAHRSAELLEAGRIFDRLLQAFFYKGQYLELLFTNIRTLNLSELAGPAPELATAYASAAATAIMIPLRKLARTYFDLAHATLKAAPDLVVETHVEMLVGLERYFLGERADAIVHTEAAMDLARRTGFSRQRDEVASVRIGADLTPGRHETALPMVVEMEASAARRGDGHMRSWALLLRAQCCLLKGTFDEAHALLTRVEALLPELGQPEAIGTFAHLAYVLLRKGELSEARRFAALAAKEASHGPPVHAACTHAYARLAEVQVALAQQAPPQLRRAAQQAAAGACRLLLRATRTFPKLAPLAAVHQGARLWSIGRRRDAQRIWREGLARARTLGDGYGGARLALSLGTTLVAQAPERAALETYAREQLIALNIGELPLPPPPTPRPSLPPAASSPPPAVYIAE